MPGNLRRYVSYYDGYSEGSQPPPLANPEPNLSTARDLARFYRRALAGEIFSVPASVATCKELLHLEDLAQGTTWPDGVVCYGKGGFLKVPPHYELGLAGALVTDDALIPFAFILNFEQADETTVAATIEGFRTTLGRVLKAMEILLVKE